MTGRVMLRPGPTSTHSIAKLQHREIGVISPTCFARRAGAAEDLVMRLKLHKNLEEHEGCVNTLCFNSDGAILASGSDDRMVKLWSWDSGVVKLSFQSGHSNNVFQSLFMPYTDDRTIVTCAADGEVRVANIPERGNVHTTLLGQHIGRAHKLAIESGSPYVFYSCGEDGLVQHFDLRTKSAMKLFICRSSEKLDPILLNAITIDPMKHYFLSTGGDDRYARVYDIRRYRRDGSSDDGCPANHYCPQHLLCNNNVGITGLAFSYQSELLMSYNDEHIYLFSKDEGLGPNVDYESSKSADADDGPEFSSPLLARAFKGHHNSETIKGVSFLGPNCEYVASGSDCGRLFIWRKSDGNLLRAMNGDKYVVNCIASHPSTAIIASSGIDKDIKMWTPTATEPSLTPKLEEIHDRRPRPWHLDLPEEWLIHALALERFRASSEEEGEDSVGNSAELGNITWRVRYGEDGFSNGEEHNAPGGCTTH